MAIENSVSNENSVPNDFVSTFVNSIGIFDCRLSGVNSLSDNPKADLLSQNEVTSSLFYLHHCLDLFFGQSEIGFRR